MFPERREFLKKVLPLIVLGIVIFVLYLYFFVDIPALAETLQRTNLLLFSFGALLVIVDICFYSLSWQHLLRALSVKAGFRETFWFTWISIFVDFVIPSESISGDITRTYLMSNELSGASGKVAASVVFQRIIFMFITLASFIAGSLACIMWHYNTPPGVLNIVFIIILITSFFLVFLVVLCIKRNWTEKVADFVLRLSEFVSRKRLRREELKPKVTEFLGVFYEGTKIFWKKPEKLFFPVVFAVLAWVMNLLICFIAFVSVDYVVPFGTIIIVYSIGVAVQYIPFGVPAEVGVTEIVMISFYSMFGVPSSVSVAGTILTRFLTAWLKLIIGFAAFQLFGVKILKKN
ncbi:MAG: lysylphosphatidylglycerol synthase transmembrane domain-containing protein [Candidatus Bathyarchaeales archaeon]